jgi:hypothetical protein
MGWKSWALTPDAEERLLSTLASCSRISVEIAGLSEPEHGVLGAVGGPEIGQESIGSVGLMLEDGETVHWMMLLI